VVVIKRKKAIALPSAPDCVRADSDGPIEEARTPRVFRVDAPILGSMRQVDVKAADVEGSPAAPVNVKRKRRRIPRSLVTIIHPPASAAPVAIDPQDMSEAEVLLERLRRLEPSLASAQAAQRFDLDVAALGRRGSSRYQVLKARIERLNQLAETMRKAEVAKAIRWIKRAIATYDLQKADLGL
jgi:hypothetical protein